jgi:hypothetical protein
MSKSGALVKRLRRELRDDINSAFDSLHGEFSLNDVAIVLQRKLVALDLNEYSLELAWSITRTEDQARTATALKPSLDLFADGELESIVIPIEDGRRVKAIDATLHHLNIKQSAQLRNLAVQTKSAQDTAELIEQLFPVMSTDPTMTIGQARRILQKG